MQKTYKIERAIDSNTRSSLCMELKGMHSRTMENGDIVLTVLNYREDTETILARLGIKILGIISDEGK